MKNIQKIILLITFLTSVFYIGCDDAGVILPFVAKGKVGFNETNLKTLDPNIDGMYQVWLCIDSANIESWSSCGKFNVNSSGAFVDINGNPAVFEFTGDTTRLGFATKVLVTVEKGSGTSPCSQVLMSGPVTVTADSVYGTMSVTGTDALGTVGEKLMEHESGKYTRWSPSTNNANPTQGIWFCDSNGVSYMPNGIALPSDGGWIYQAWIVDNTNQSYRSIGRFFDPKGVDDDLSGPCSGPNAGFNAPGQDWILTGGECGSEINVVSGNYSLLITIEPSNESPRSLEENTPSFFKVYTQHIDPSLGSGQLDYIYSIYTTEFMPKAYIKITN